MKDESPINLGPLGSSAIEGRRALQQVLIQNYELDIESKIMRRLRDEGILSNLVNGLPPMANPTVDGLAAQVIALIKTVTQNQEQDTVSYQAMIIHPE